MPADPSIYGLQVTPRINTPFENLAQVLQIRQQQESNRTLAEQRRALAQQTQERTKLLQQQQADTAAIDAAMSAGKSPEDILALVPGHLRGTIQKQFQDAAEWDQKVKTAKAEAEKAELGYAAHLASGVLAWEKDGPEALLNAANAALQLAKSHGHDVSQLESVIAQDPTKLKPMLQSIIAQHQGPQAPKSPVEVNPGNSLVDPQTGKAIYTAPPKVERETRSLDVQAADALARGDQVEYARLLKVKKEMGQADDRPRVNVTVGSGAGSDAEAIADAIISGQQPPTMTGLYRLGGPVRTALARKGYNFSNASLDWQATTKHLSTLNNAQQTRLRQAVDVAYHSLDVIDSLADQWKGGRFPLLNRASLATARSGAMGKEAQTIANQLTAQITDLTSELGNVYMGGNSPTDHALQLAGKNLSADWSNDVLRDMTKLARTNLQIRRNSMETVGVAGASANNPYASKSAPAPNTVPAPPVASAPAGMIRARDPQGNIHEAKQGTPLPAGWTIVGGG